MRAAGNPITPSTDSFLSQIMWMFPFVVYLFAARNSLSHSLHLSRRKTPMSENVALVMMP
jgi:hypothetical protein